MTPYSYQAKRQLTVNLKALLARADIVKNNPELLEQPFGDVKAIGDDRLPIGEDAYIGLVVRADAVSKDFSRLAREHRIFNIIPTPDSELYADMARRIRQAADDFRMDAQCNRIS